MSHLIRSSLALVGLALVLPSGVLAQDAGQEAYGGYRSYTATPAPTGLDGKPLPAPAAPAPASAGYVMMAPAPAAAAPAPAMGYSVPAEAKHTHKGKTLCASCAAKARQAQGMQAQGMPPGVIVSCAHSKNGVCPTCRDLLAMPGTVTVGNPATPPMAGEAPGRAMASSGSPAPSAGAQGMASRTASDVSVAYGPQGAGYDPAPIGVVQTNYSQMYGPATMPGSASASAGSLASQPGHATASSSAGSTPYAPKNGPFPHPHILGHLFGFSGIGNERRDEKAQKKAAAHASISYDNEGTTVSEIPASMLKKGH